jgi:hypothetical protein
LHATQVPVHAVSQHTPSAQNPEAQAVPLVQGWPLAVVQLPLPSHACPFEQLPGTSVPAFAATQVPSEPFTLHDLQGPLQEAASQHTPSTQKPLAQDDAPDEEHP